MHTILWSEVKAGSLAVVLVAAGASGSRAAAGTSSFEVALWPAAAAASTGAATVVERGTAELPDRMMKGHSASTLTVYLPDKGTRNGAAVVICPGGGYGGLAIDKEGHRVARWLNSNGVAGLVLKYRLPRVAQDPASTYWPLQDATRAVRLARARAAEWGIDPAKVGIMGFSAGGHLASTLATHWDRGRADAAEPLDRPASRPDFAILVYPVITFTGPAAHAGSRQNLLGASPGEERIKEFSNDQQVNKETPPTFLVHARDDGVKVENTFLFQRALASNGVPCEAFVIDTGGHGFGLGVRGGEAATWPARCLAWLKARGFVP